MFGLGTVELVIILVIIVIIFGVGKLPELGGGIGKALRNFKKASEDGGSASDKQEEDASDAGEKDKEDEKKS